MTPVVYDIESYPNLFTLTAISMDRDDLFTWEISDRCDDRESLWKWLQFLYHNQVEMIGFNNAHFDYHFIHFLLLNPASCTASTLHALCERIIAGTEPPIWQDNRLIPQIDVFKINHFDNKARRTSLKALEFAMRSESIQDLPFPPGTVLTPPQMDKVRTYNGHDVTETRKFARYCSEHIEFRRYLMSGTSPLSLTGDVMNFNDTKIGKQYLIQQLGENVCYHRVNGKREPRQTFRYGINVGEIILPCIRFDQPEFNRILEWFRSQVITDTNGVFKNVSATINGFEFVFGTGGIHGSIERKHIQADDDHELLDVDAKSLYPSIGIAYGLYPEHLGETFTVKYSGMKQQRFTYTKEQPENAMLKLALNGVYGDSNNLYSPFYDPKYTMSITINGQLMLCMLAEMIMTVPTVELIQINTDGITVKIRKQFVQHFEHVCNQWEQITRLDLEQARYSDMWIRDVNSYIAKYTDVKTKLKGAYWYPTNQKEYDGWWHKDFSAMIVQKSVHTALMHGMDPADLIRCGTDPYDFMLRGKAESGAKLYIGDEQQQKITRYFIARNGESMYTMRPPVEGATGGAFCKARNVSWYEYNKHDPFVWNPAIHTKNKSVYKNRKTALQDGWKVVECNEASRFDWSNLDYDWYIAEARKLMIE